MASNFVENFYFKLRGCARSATIYFNGVALSALGVLPMLQDALPTLQQYAPDIKWLAFSVIIGNVLLRFKTSMPLEHK